MFTIAVSIFIDCGGSSELKKSDEGFKRRNTYESGLNWRFGNDNANPWRIIENVDYPRLYWEQ